MESDGYSKIQVIIDPQYFRDKYSLGDRYLGVLKLSPDRNLNVAGICFQIKCKGPQDNFLTYGYFDIRELAKGEVYTSDNNYHYISGPASTVSDTHSIYIPLVLGKNLKKPLEETVLSYPLEVIGYRGSRGIYPLYAYNHAMRPQHLPLKPFLSSFYWPADGTIQTVIPIEFLPSFPTNVQLNEIDPISFIFKQNMEKLNNSGKSAKFFRFSKRKLETKDVVLIILPEFDDIIEVGSTIKELILHIWSPIDSLETNLVVQDSQSTKLGEFSIVGLKVFLISESFITRKGRYSRKTVICDINSPIMFDVTYFKQMDNNYQWMIDIAEKNILQIPQFQYPDSCDEKKQFWRTHQLEVELDVKGDFQTQSFSFTKDVLLLDDLLIQEPPSYSQTIKP